ncbi:hypothetical protein XarbCFBP7408_19625 [Xanthomonas arboricola pv. guizotiae]|uniref:Uncharacterized protein n=1 Tax=Xanthomonas arboricola pv. guizotiae TaxID=487867 RepID=A0A2S6ZU31_9XANT|nr:hypothetical protein XarbCFBP7409_16755 [Xanthomonas arboricola pv. guizotiae]PPU19139.1 hypothetical protein XarbCFBP7408_19625 [Xanthomonas arboricola pv. guizotiae]
MCTTHSAGSVAALVPHRTGSPRANWSPAIDCWLAYDMRPMMAGIQTHGMRAAAGTVEKLQAMPGRPLRTSRKKAAAP